MVELSRDDAKVMNRGMAVIQEKRRRNLLRSRYVDGKKNLEKVGISIPPQMADFAAVLGWPEKAFMSPARRIRPDGFSAANDTDLLDEIRTVFAENEMASAERLLIQSALKHGVSFAFTTRGDDALGEPETLISARSALEASAVVDVRSRRTRSAVELTGRDSANLYLPGRVLDCTRRTNGRWNVNETYPTTPGWVACTPFVWGATLERPYGKSRVTRTVMDLTDMAVRVMLRQEVSAEFYSSPQRYMLGASEEHFVGPNGEARTGWEAIIGAMLAIPDIPDDEMDELKRVTVGQFPQMTMQPHTDHLKSVAMMFSGETSIPVNHLGIIQDNPQSAEAINANEADLVSVVEDELPSLGLSRVSLARDVLAVKYREWTPAMAADLRGLRADFRNPGTPTESAMGDAMIKFAGAIEGYGKTTVGLRRAGFTNDEIESMRAEWRREEAGSRLQALLNENGASDDGQAALNAALVAKAQGDALGSFRRAGVEANDAAQRAGLDGVRFIPGDPITIRREESGDGNDR